MGLLKTWLGRPDLNDFAALMIRALRNHGETEPITYHPQEFKLAIGKDAGHYFYLHNAYRDYRSVPRRRHREVVERYLHMITQSGMEVPCSLDDAIAHILPVVRARAYFELNILRNQTEGLEGWNPPYRMLGADLA